MSTYTKFTAPCIVQKYVLLLKAWQIVSLLGRL